MLHVRYSLSDCLEAGVDEAGRGCLAGPVVAAAVILRPDFSEERLNDSKKLSPARRNELSALIKENALAYAVGHASAEEIDKVNILRASFLAMHRAIDALSCKPELLLIDGNRFLPHRTPHVCIVKGDARYQSIAAASILAKTYRDEWMTALHQEYPCYNWKVNKGYPTRLHRIYIRKFGLSTYHRRTFRWKPSVPEKMKRIFRKNAAITLFHSTTVPLGETNTLK